MVSLWRALEGVGLEWISIRPGLGFTPGSETTVNIFKGRGPSMDLKRPTRAKS